MRLKSRIKKLQEENKTVYIRHYSLFQFDGYKASENIGKFWTLAVMVLTFAFFLFCVGTWYLVGQQRGLNPELVKAETTQRQQDADSNRKDKQQYIDSCKANGKSPNDMGNNQQYWACK